jgi:YedE family putative selenium metabolism protein
MLLFGAPSFILLNSKGHAPLLVSLVAGLVIGFLAQRSRLCFVGGIRDVILMRNFHLFQGIIAFFVLCLVLNLSLGQFNPGQHPIAHTNHLAGFLGLLLVGWGSVLIGGCPFRQMVLAGYGNTDSGISFLGMLAGSALAHNFLLAGTPSGVSAYGVVATFIGMGVFFVIGMTNRVT